MVGQAVQLPRSAHSLQSWPLPSAFCAPRTLLEGVFNSRRGCSSLMESKFWGEQDVRTHGLFRAPRAGSPAPSSVIS